MKPTSPSQKLRWWYNKANKEAFQGKLPKIFVGYKRLEDGGTHAAETHSQTRIDYSRGRKGRKTLVATEIRVNPRFRDCEQISLCILMHEIVHVGELTAQRETKCRTKAFSKKVAALILKLAPEVL